MDWRNTAVAKRWPDILTVPRVATRRADAAPVALKPAIVGQHDRFVSHPDRMPAALAIMERGVLRLSERCARACLDETRCPASRKGVA